MLTSRSQAVICGSLMSSISQKLLEHQNKHTSRYSGSFSILHQLSSQFQGSCFTRTNQIPNKLVLRNRESKNDQMLYLHNVIVIPTQMLYLRKVLCKFLRKREWVKPH